MHFHELNEAMLLSVMAWRDFPTYFESYPGELQFKFGSSF